MVSIPLPLIYYLSLSSTQTRQHLVVGLYDCHEGLLRHVDLAHRPHALLALGLFLQKLLLPADVSSIALGEDILHHCGDLRGGYRLGSDTCLNGDLQAMVMIEQSRVQSSSVRVTVQYYIRYG